MKQSDIQQMKIKFVEAFGNQYKQWSLTDLSKEKAIDPRTKKTYTSVKTWLEIVSEDEAKEFLEKQNNTNQTYVVLTRDNGDLVGYMDIRIMNDGLVAYLAQAFVSPDIQKCGAWKSFIKELLPSILPESAQVLTLLVRAPHNDSAAKAHQHVGFSFLPKELSVRYANLLDYPLQYYVAMAQSIKEGVNASNLLKRILDTEDQKKTY